jgi:hypothetical protein
MAARVSLRLGLALAIKRMRDKTSASTLANCPPAREEGPGEGL